MFEYKRSSVVTHFNREGQPVTRTIVYRKRKDQPAVERVGTGYQFNWVRLETTADYKEFKEKSLANLTKNQ